MFCICKTCCLQVKQRMHCWGQGFLATMPHGPTPLECCLMGNVWREFLKYIAIIFPHSIFFFFYSVQRFDICSGHGSGQAVAGVKALNIRLVLRGVWGWPQPGKGIMKNGIGKQPPKPPKLIWDPRVTQGEARVERLALIKVLTHAFLVPLPPSDRPRTNMSL